MIDGNRFEGNLFGIYVHGAAGSRVERTVVEGLWKAALLRKAMAYRCGMRLTSPWPTTRFVTAATGHLHGFQPQGSVHQQPLRSGVSASRFTTCTPTTAKSAQRLGRQSRRLRHHVFEPVADPGNLSDHDRDYGLLFNYANYAEIDGNRVVYGPP